MAIPNVKRFRPFCPTCNDSYTLMAVLPQGANVEQYLAEAVARHDPKAFNDSKTLHPKVRVGQQKQKKAKSLYFSHHVRRRPSRGAGLGTLTTVWPAGSSSHAILPELLRGRRPGSPSPGVPHSLCPHSPPVHVPGRFSRPSSRFQAVHRAPFACCYPPPVPSGTAGLRPCWRSTSDCLPGIAAV